MLSIFVLSLTQERVAGMLPTMYVSMFVWDDRSMRFNIMGVKFGKINTKIVSRFID